MVLRHHVGKVRPEQPANHDLTHKGGAPNPMEALASNPDKRDEEDYPQDMVELVGLIFDRVV